jgi:hypothetical protein
LRHHGNGKLAITPPTVPRARALSQVSLCTNCAHGYNPLGNPKDETHCSSRPWSGRT